MRRTTIYCAVVAIALLAFLLLACDHNPQNVEYCTLEPKPLICNQ